MGDDPSKTRLQRALGAALLSLVAIAALWAGHTRWMVDGPSTVFDPIEVRLDLATAFRFATQRKGAEGRPPMRAGERVVVPPGGAVSWSVRVPMRGGLGAAEIELAPTTTDPGSRAELHVASDGGLQRTYPLKACTRACRVPLGDFEGRIARITARGPPADAAAGRPLVLVSPVIYGDPPIAPPDPADHGSRPPIILYLMDTLRADKLGAY
ncbi:MAG: hypothetical protein OEV20_01380, partial [Actinomycetota bacterium]|nr:hypothetical protein [Actinomycetota bacterium]